MYFFSEIDPNYRIKGSRDPLGFQTLWAAAGHRAVAYLSTVSANLRDFMILAYGIYFYANRDEKRFLTFFLKFEQLCAYARRIYDLDKGFNGIDFVNKKREDNKFSISLQPSDMLLSNQRTYGIYGKYIRPFRDMGMVDDPDFSSIMEGSLAKTSKTKVEVLINQILSCEISTVTKEQLQPIANLLKSITIREKEIYSNYILKIPNENHPQNNLYEIVKNNQQIAESEFGLHSTIQAIISQNNISDALSFALENIRNTDKVLFPLNRCFTHLLSQSLWSEDQLEEDDFLKNLPKPVDCDFQDETMRELNSMLALDVVHLVDDIIKRNEKVKQGGRAWIIKEKGSFKVIYGENGQKQKELNFNNDYEFPYFLNTYLSLYKQIEINS